MVLVEDYTRKSEVPFATLAAPPRLPPAKTSQRCSTGGALKHRWTGMDVRDDGRLRPLQPLRYQVLRCE